MTGFVHVSAAAEPPNPNRRVPSFLLGMHKKSIEAAHKLNEDDGPMTSPSDVTKPGSASSRDKNEIRSESIATLRAKAQEHNAKMLEALHPGGGGHKSDDSTTSSHLLGGSDTSNDDIDLTNLTHSH